MTKENTVFGLTVKTTKIIQYYKFIEELEEIKNKYLQLIKEEEKNITILNKKA